MIKLKDMGYFRSIVSLSLLILSFGIAEAQQVPMYSQYIMNGFLVNPSFAGRDGYTTVNLTVREQWSGLAQAPSTYALSFQTRVLNNSYISKSTAVKKRLVKPTRGGRVGAGGYVFSDNNGIMRRTGIQAAYAYHIPMGNAVGDEPSDLAFGLALIAYQYSINTDGLIYDHDDPYLNSYDRSVFIPDFNFGASYATSRYYLGFSMTNMMRGSVVFGNSGGSRHSELGHYFLTGGIKFPLSANWVIEPSAFIKSSDMLFKAIQLDLTSRIYYKNDYWAGLSWRTNDALILLLGINYNRFYFAYAWDFTLTDIRKQSFGSHELTLAVKFGAGARRYRWLNAF
ncbi:MAG: type IX secretion system membrane protein PorP/SprF [Bacteroidales bacterium]